MAADPTAEASPAPPAFVVALPPDHPDPTGKDITLPPDPELAELAGRIPAIGSPTVTLPPNRGPDDTPTRDDASFSSLLQSRSGVRSGADHGSVVSFGDGDGTMDYTPPPTVPGYELLHEVGRGGMGVVYKAMQVGLNRPVALKMILAGSHAGPRERDRFRREAEAVATLQNPHIVQIFEIGEASGHLYLALEYVDGGSLAQYLRGTPWPAKDAAELVELLARAVHYAHQQGVVHRDLKPGNILLAGKTEPRAAKSGPDDRSALVASSEFRVSNFSPKVSDFGLAKRLGDSGNPDGTKTGAVMGTPSYIAPEQASGKTRDVGTGVDVYSLGAILYELLTGRPPFLGETPLDTVLQVLHDDPVPPKRLQPTIPRDLETICLKCLHKNPSKRYASADLLADDLRRFLTGEPIRARPLSSWGRSVKWAKRHPSLAVLGAVTVAATVALVAVLSVAYSRVRDAVEQKELARENEAGERMKAQLLAADNERKRKEAAELARENDIRRAEAVNQNKELKRQMEERRRAAYALQLAQVAAMCEREPRRAQTILEDESRCPPDLRDFTWAYLRRLCQRSELVYAEHQPRDAPPAADPIRAVAYSPARTFVATAGNAGQVRVWDPRTGLTWAVLLGSPGAIRAVAFTPDGEAIAAAGSDGTIRFWELPVGMLEGARQTLEFIPVFKEWIRPLALFPSLTLPEAHTGEINCIAFSPDGRRLVSGGDDGRLRWWDLGGWRTTNPDVAAAGGTAATAALLAQTQTTPRPVWLSRETDAHHEDGKSMAVKSLAFSASGNVLVSGGADHTARLWQPEGRYQIRAYPGHDEAVVAVAASPDGKTIATVNNGATPTVRLINAETGRDLRRLVGHTHSIYALAFSPDGELIASAGFDKSVRVWDADGQERAALFGHDQSVSSIAFAPDRRTLVSAGMDAIARVWQTTARTHESVQLSRELTLTTTMIAPGRHPAEAATYIGGDTHGRVVVSRSDLLPRGRGTTFYLTKVPVGQPPARGPVQTTAAPTDGHVVLAAVGDRVFVWRMLRLPGTRVSPSAPFPPIRPISIKTPLPVYAMAVDHTGRWLATLDSEGVCLWDIRGLAADRALELRGPGRIRRIPNAREVAFHPRAELIAVSVGSNALLIDRTGKVISDLPRPHEGKIEAIAFGGKDKDYMATGDDTGLINVWRVEPTGKLTFVSSLIGHTGAVYTLAFSPDGSTLASGGNDRTVLLWDPVSGQERATLTGHTDRVLRVQFLADSSALISIARDGGVKRWRADRYLVAAGLPQSPIGPAAIGG